MRAFTVHSDFVPYFSLAAIWMAMSALVNPIGNFPLNDDWLYALGVKSILEAGRFEMPVPAAPNVFAQAYWGAMFCLPFGFSFTALRISTLTLGAMGIFTFYLLLREIGGSRSTALLGGLSLAVNPLYFALANTFMTDVPLVALSIAAVWLFIRGIARKETVSLLAGIGVALLAVLIRQFALLLLFAFGVAYVVRRGATWRAFVAAIVPLVSGIGLHAVFQHWMVTTGKTPSFALASWPHLIPTPFGTFMRSFLRLGLSLPYLGFFLTPFLISVARCGSDAAGLKRPRLWLLVIPLTGALLAAIYIYIPVPPQIGHILAPTGLGPRTLRGDIMAPPLGLRQNFPTISAAGSAFWSVSIIVGAVAGAAIFLYLCWAGTQVAAGLWRSERRSAIWLPSLMLSFICGYAILLFLVSYGLGTPLLDRYVLLPVPEIFAVVLLVEISSGGQMQHWRFVLSIALILIYATVDVAITHDYLAWNRAR